MDAHISVHFARVLSMLDASVIYTNVSIYYRYVLWDLSSSLKIVKTNSESAFLLLMKFIDHAFQ